jgi:hypothetical protein
MSFGSVVEAVFGFWVGETFYCMLGRFEREVVRSLENQW